jgi:anti-sigma B factor antagonist
VSLKLLSCDEIAVICLSGDVDMEDVVGLRNLIASIMGGGCTQFVLDLARVQHMNSTALGILADSLHRLRVVHGDLRLSGLNPYLKNLFELMGLARVFRMFSDRNDAITSFKPMRCAA